MIIITIVKYEFFYISSVFLHLHCFSLNTIHSPKSKVRFFFFFLKVHKCRFENFTICLGSYQNNILKISYSLSKEFSRYLPVKFVFLLKGRLISNIIYCFSIFVSKHFTISNAYKECYNVKPSGYYFYVKTKISVNFHVYISVYLKQKGLIFMKMKNLMSWNERRKWRKWWKRLKWSVCKKYHVWEADTGVKKALLKISLYSQENTCVGVSF